MGSFGGRLQREREMRGITLEEIAEATKIGTRSLQALESEEFDKLPGGIFNKGFVRAYAKYLGIDQEQAVADYMSAIGEDREDGAEAEARSVDTLKAVAAAKQAAAEASGAPAANALGSLGIVAVILLLLAITAVGGWRYWRARSAAVAPAAQATVLPPAQTANTTAPPASAANAAGGNTKDVTPPPPAKPVASAATANARPAAIATEFELQIRAKEDSWMSITADGKEVMSGILKATTQTSVRARQRVVLKVGNAGGVEISRNGRTLPALGQPGETRTVTITAAGLQR